MSKALLARRFAPLIGLIGLGLGLGALPGGTVSLTAQAVPAEAGSLDPSQLQQLVAPIALYPDPLVAQVLTASTYPTQIADAESFLQQNASLSPSALASVVNQQDWDPSVMALTEYPTVLAQLNESMAWTSALGDAYYNQPDDVMNAVQTLRQRAVAAGTLRSTPQLAVETAPDGTISINSVSSTEVYVPNYDPWVDFGAPFSPWPGYVLAPGIAARPGIYFGVGFNLGAFAGYGWSQRNWAPDWNQHRIEYNRQPYVSRSQTFYQRPSGSEQQLNQTHNQARYTPAQPSRGATPARQPPAPRQTAPRQPAPRQTAPRQAAPRQPAAPARPQPSRPVQAAPVRGTASASPQALRGFTPQPSPPRGTSSTVFSGATQRAASATRNAVRGQSSLRSTPAPRAPSRPATPARGAPPPSRGRGRGGQQ